MEISHEMVGEEFGNFRRSKPHSIIFYKTSTDSKVEKRLKDATLEEVINLPYDIWVGNGHDETKEDKMFAIAKMLKNQPFSLEYLETLYDFQFGKKYYRQGLQRAKEERAKDLLAKRDLRDNDGRLNVSDARISRLSIDEIKVLLNDVVEDNEIDSKRTKRRIITKIINNQPHRTINFKKFNVHNDDIRRKIIVDSVPKTAMTPVKIVGKNAMVSALIGSGLSLLGMIPGLVDGTPALTNWELLDTFIMGSLEATFQVFPYMLAIFGVITLLRFAFCSLIFFGSNSKYSSGPFFRFGSEYLHGEIINDESGADESNENDHVDGMSNRIDDILDNADGIDETRMPIESADSVSISTKISAVKSDYDDAIQRIASYETDISKAISYPAFNDVSVPEVSAMLKQLRKCERLISTISVKTNKKGEFTDEESLIHQAISEVDVLWVDIHTAEKIAEKIAWSDFSEKDKKDMILAQQLISQVSDAANTDSMRTNLLNRLKKVVDRLNSKTTVIPSKVVAEIEHQTRLMIETV